MLPIAPVQAVKAMKSQEETKQQMTADAERQKLRLPVKQQTADIMMPETVRQDILMLNHVQTNPVVQQNVQALN